MDNTLCRREVARPRRLSAAAADSGASVSLQDGEPIEMHSPRESQTVLDRLSAAGGNMDRMNPAMMVVHKRHMPKEPNKFHIPRKAKEKRALFQYVSTESREFEDMMNILTSSYFDPGSAGCFTYSKPCLVHSELQEKEFVEKRREMKADGRTEKELEENYCFLLADAVRLPLLCENGLCVGQTWLTVLGNPHKGVYLSKYSDLLQVSLFAPGAVGEIIIFKVMKGKVKSIYENVKNLLDPTPRFDSHIFKNASKVTSLTSFRAFEFTQQYFYEYSFDELRQRPRQVCPYAVVSFQFKGKDTILPRLNSQPAEGNKVRAQFTVWTGDLVKGDRVLCQISLRSFSPPFLPHRLPEKLDIGRVMRLDQVTMLLPSGLFSYNRYNSSEEVEENGHYCRLLEVIDRGRTTSTMTKLLQEMEMMRVVLVTPLSEKGFLFLLSSVQMATPSERGENWKRCLQALFVFPETRDLAKSTSRCASSPHDASESQMSGTKVMPHLSLFIPALHHALVKARANPSPELSAGVERQTKEYLIGLKDGKVRQYPMGEYDSKQDEQEKVFPTPKHHQVNMNSYLRSYLANRALYLLSVARARQVVETHCGPEEPQQIKPKNSCGGLRESAGKEMTGITRDGETNSQKMQQLLDLVLTCKRNAENEVKREEGREGGLRAAGRKRRLEQKTAVRALKYLKASQGPAGHDKIPVEGSQPASPDSLTSVIASVGLRDSHLREDGSELSVKLLSLLTGLSRAARGSTSQEEEQKESCPFERLATKLGLPTNCDIDLRKQEELEEQTAGSVSSLEGFSPSSHSGEMNLHRAAGGRGGRGAGGYEDEEEWEIPWVLIPITGLCSKRLSPKDRLIPQDPRFRHLAATTHITTATKPSRKSPTQSPVPSPPASPFQCLSPEPSPPLSPSQCPSPDPSPPLSPSQCPSPDTSPPFSPSQCPSPEPSPCSSPSRCPSSMFPSHLTSPHRRLSLSPYQSQSLVSVELKPINKGNSGANDENFPPITSREFTGMSKDKQENPQEKEKNQQPYFFTSVQPSIPQAAEKSTSPSPLPFANRKQYAQKEIRKVKEEDAVLPKEQKDNQPVEKVQQHKEEGVSWYKQEEESVVNRTQEIAHEKEQKGKVNELISGSLVSQSLSSPPAHPLRDIDNIVDKHIGDFFTEMQHLLQEESIHCSFPEPPHSTLNTANLAPQHTFQPGLPAQFSHYVSLYNSCPPVQDYVSSLQDSINSMMTEFGDNCHHRNSHSSQSEADTVLASSVSAFVSSIRASNTKTSEVCAPCGDLTAADDTFSVCQTPALSRGGKVLQPDATHNSKSPALNIIVTVPTSASDSVYKPGDTTDLHSPSHKLPQSHWNSQQSHTLENKRTVLYNVRQDNSFTKTMDCMSDAEGGSSLAGSNTGCLGSSIVSKPLAEPSHSPQQESTSASGSGPAPPATALSSLINQLEPEVFNSLVKIIKDVKKNSLQFYLHSTEPRDHVFDNVKAYLVKQGNVEKSPVAFLNQENPDNRLLVIIKNKDIAGHIHKIPCLVSLKRRPSVLFVGIDTLDDIRNNSYNELFVSGGCVVSDELILNPDFITYDQLAELLKLLEQHSSLESVWKWKVHCKTHKKLKEQARFRRDSAKILDLLSAYQKKQIVEFLPYHHCDMMNHQSPDLECLTELQARYTQFRHTVFLTERFLKKSPEYLSGGIIVGGIEEILHNFTRMVGYHNVKDRQPVLDALLATKGAWAECTLDLCSLLTTVSEKIMAAINSSQPCIEIHKLMPLDMRKLTNTRKTDQPHPDSTQAGTSFTPQVEVEEPRLHRTERQENVAPNKKHDHYSALLEVFGDLYGNKPPPSQTVSAERTRRLQLYNRHGQRFSDQQLLNPMVWSDIYCARPGWVPKGEPYHQLGQRYWDLRAASTVVFVGSPHHLSSQTRVPCGVICYDHPEGPWCELQSPNGTQICVLAAPSMLDTS
ncbi:protein TASOR isoform X2 [Solea solea]|uniref:protein TASOR isoform X2 n=1 Tax=Solea solea TaxID=90069 RepID=UPI00272B51A2|nr:protein TASOR isoform X2 [Solea solea]